MFSKNHHTTFLSGLDFTEHFLSLRNVLAREMLFLHELCVCNTEHGILYIPSTPTFPSSVGQAGSCHPGHRREVGSETTQCEKRGKSKVPQILHFNNVSASKSLLEVLISAVRLMFSVLGGRAQLWWAGSRGCTSHLDPALMLWRPQGEGEPIPVYGALFIKQGNSSNCKLVLTKEHCMASQLYVFFPAFGCLLL